MSKFALGAAAGLLAVSLALGAQLSSPPMAMAESNGVGLRPAMGWSSWSFLRAAPTETAVEAQAKAMVTSGLASVGYEYVNVDSGWYSCPGPQGPTVDRYGRWHIDPTKFPSHGSVSGIEAVANYVHHLGLKFGLYVTPGISEQAIARNTIIKGTRYHADDIGTSTADDAVWAKYSNGWRTGPDIECYCSSTSYPLTDWANVASRFDQVAASAPYGRGGAHNDYDSLEIGNGTNDGLTPAERQTQMTLWALGASAMILGSDLTHLDHADLSYVKNRAVIAVDQDGIDAKRIIDTDTEQVFTETEPKGEHVVGLFNTSTQPAVIATTAEALRLPARRHYALINLWTHHRSETSGVISAEAPAHGVALFLVSRDHS